MWLKVILHYVQITLLLFKSQTCKELS